MQLIYLSPSKPPPGKSVSNTVRQLADTVTKSLFRDVAQLQNTWQAAKNSLKEKNPQSCLSYQINPLLLVNNREKLGSSAHSDSLKAQRE